MNDDVTFAEKIHKRFPEGLTGLFAVGGTRTAYILEVNRNDPEPGRIKDFAGYSTYGFEHTLAMIATFLKLGGQNAIISALSFRSYFERGPEYAQLVTPELERMIDHEATGFYRQHDIDPYFVGIDTLLTFPEDNGAHQVARRLTEFQENWSYAPERRKLIWEIASLPLFSLWQALENGTEEERQSLRHQIENATGLQELHTVLYQHCSRKILGTDLPHPHFYLGTNKSGDLKVRSPLMVALTAGEYLRLYYTPYPSFFVTQDAMQAILEDVAFNERFHADNTDYRGQFTPELAQEEYDRVIKLSSDPNAILGYARRIVT